MKNIILSVSILIVLIFFCRIQGVGSSFASAQDKSAESPTWVRSDVNPTTVFWIQGRFVPITDAQFSGDPEVATILCSERENECMEMDSTSPFPNMEQTWIQDFKTSRWDKNGIVAASRSLDDCTDETLKINFSPSSVVLINSPVLPISANCKQVNDSWDKLAGEKGAMLKGQVEQDILVSTRGVAPFQDSKSVTVKTDSTPYKQ